MNAIPRPCSENELLLHGLADNELDAANSLCLEHHLQTCDGCSTAYADILRVKQRLAAPGIRLNAPHDFRARFLSALEAENRPLVPQGITPVHKKHSGFEKINWMRRTAPALAIAATLLVFINVMQPRSHLENEFVAGHVRSLLAAHLTDVASSDQHTVKPWFLGKLDFAPPVIDLKDRDFPLIGGRLDYVGGHVVAAVVYKRRGHVINLFIWPAGRTEPASDAFEGYHLLSWTDGSFNFVAVSDLNPTEMTEFRDALKAALS